MPPVPHYMPVNAAMTSGYKQHRISSYVALTSSEIKFNISMITGAFFILLVTSICLLTMSGSTLQHVGLIEQSY